MTAAALLTCVLPALPPAAEGAHTPVRCSRLEYQCQNTLPSLSLADAVCPQSLWTVESEGSSSLKIVPSETSGRFRPLGFKDFLSEGISHLSWEVTSHLSHGMVSLWSLHHTWTRSLRNVPSVWAESQSFSFSALAITECSGCVCLHGKGRRNGFRGWLPGKFHIPIWLMLNSKRITPLSILSNYRSWSKGFFYQSFL